MYMYRIAKVPVIWCRHCYIGVNLVSNYDRNSSYHTNTNMGIRKQNRSIL